jgi:hypothetical protein
MNQQPFTANFSKTKSISATSTTASVTLDATDVQGTTSYSTTPTGGNGVMRVVNIGPNTAFIRWGVGAQTALTSDMPILAGTVELLNKATTADTIAAICASAQTATIYITCGEGA